MPFIAATKRMLYQYYASELLRHGTIAWRVASSDLHVVLMNAHNCETGDFMVSFHL